MACNTYQGSLFGEAVSNIFNSWSALQLAVDQGFGGHESREKADWMVYAVETWFKENDGIETYEVEDFLENVLNEEFDLKVEDGSISEISAMICTYYRLCQENKVEELRQRLQTLPKASIHGSRLSENMEEMDSDTEPSDLPIPMSTPIASADTYLTPQPSAHSEDSEVMENEEEPLEEGWKVIRKGRRKR